jgi:hypothetical protein
VSNSTISGNSASNQYGGGIDNSALAQTTHKTAHTVLRTFNFIASRADVLSGGQQLFYIRQLGRLRTVGCRE